MDREMILILDRSGDIALDLGGSDEMELVIESGTSAAAYAGPYTVTPTLHADQTLETSGLLMTDDLKVKEIPVVYTTNPHNGQTVVIG